MTGAKGQQSCIGNNGVRKIFGKSKIGKPQSRLSINNDKASKAQYRSSLPRPSSSSRKYLMAPKQVSRQDDQKVNPIFKEVVPLHGSKRKAFGNLSNSPTVSQEAPTKGFVKSDRVATTEEIEFKSDPNALASILNNEGVTTELLQQNAIQEGRPSMVADNTYLFLDGRPSLCRRVPIQRVKKTGETRRATTHGPRRVLSSATKGSGPRYSVGQRSSLLQPGIGSSRHSLYSVVQGRFSDANSIRPDRKMSLLAGKKTSPEREKENFKLSYKSPPAVRVLPKEVRISASPALRVKQPVHVTPQPQRSAKKTNQRGVKWADENSRSVKDNLVTSLFQDYSPNSTPMTTKPVKTPVSILKNRKHSKRNSLTPPMLKKEKKTKDDDGVEEIVKPQVLNDFGTDLSRNDKNKELKMPKSALKCSSIPKQKAFSPGISAKKTSEIQPRVLLETSPVLRDFRCETEMPDLKLKEKQENIDESPNLIEVDKIFKIMNRHMSKVKRRSVQAEFSNVLTKISASLKSNGLQDETILETEEESENQSCKSTASVTIKKEKATKPEVTEVDSFDKKSYSTFFPLTPGTIKDIQENGDEQCKKDFDQIAMDTEKIEQELKKLKLEKERLVAFQEKIKNTRSRQRGITMPELKKEEALPSFSRSQNLSSQPNSHPDLSTSWEKVLKSDMNSSPASTINTTSRSLDTSSVSPAKKLNNKAGFLGTASPQVSALHLEKTKLFSKPHETCKNLNSFQSNILKPAHVKSKELTSQAIERNVNQTLAWKNESNTGPEILPSTKPNSFQPEAAISSPIQPSPTLDFSFLKPKSTTSLSSAAPDNSLGSFPARNPTKLSVSPLMNSTDLSLASAATTSFATQLSSSDKGSFCASSNLLRIKQQLEKPIFADFPSPTLSQESGSLPFPPTTPRLRVPNPIFPNPHQTPGIFRTLRTLRDASPAKPISIMKQHFAQALLDEEVSLLTCKVVRPVNVKQSSKDQDPVAHSLSHGDDKHFVPIIKTPSATPVRNKRSSFGDSAFAKYLRS